MVLCSDERPGHRGGTVPGYELLDTVTSTASANESDDSQGHGKSTYDYAESVRGTTK